MVCDSCLKKLKEPYIGKVSDNGYECKNVLPMARGTIFFQGYKPYFKLFAQGEKTTKGGKIMKKEFDLVIRSKFCPNCGIKIEDQDAKEVS